MKTDNTITIADAVTCLTNALRDDPDYFMTWQANIAMAFVDECCRHPTKPSRTKMHGMANTGAINFLNMLISQGEPAPDESYFKKDELWQTAGQFPVNKALLDKAQPFDESDIDPSDEVLPDEVEDNEDAKTIAERADQKETKIDLKDL